MIDKDKLIKIAKFLAKLAITFVALYLVSRQIELDALKELILTSKLSYLLLALLLFSVAKIIEALRANMFFKVLGIQMSEVANAKLYMLGMFYNLFLPGGIGGDSYRAYWLKKKFETGLKDLITVFLLNRIAGLVALVSLLLIAGKYVTDVHHLMGYAFVLVPLLIGAYFIIIKRFLSSYNRTSVSAILLSLLIQLLQVVSAHFVLYAFGINQDFGSYWFLFLLSGIAFIVPITVGGVGSRELVFLYGAAVLPIDLNSCIALSLVIYCMRALVSLGGVYFLMYPEKIIDKS